MRNSLRLVVSLFFSLILSSCSVEAPNVEVCIKLINRADCYWTIDGEPRQMSEEEFYDNSLGIIFMKPESWAEIRKFIEKVCTKPGACTTKVKELGDLIDEKLDEF